jgi:hypothetical protein
MSAEERQAFSERVEASRRHEENMRKCSAVRCHAERGSALANEGLRQMQKCRSPNDFVSAQKRLRTAQDASEQLQHQALGQLMEQSAIVLRPVQLERSSCLAQVSALAGGRDTTAILEDAAQAGASGHAAVEDLLQQLKMEPQENDECIAKFQLYETFFSQVEKTRRHLFGFHEECVSSVPALVAADMKRQIKAIDSTEAMGIPERTRAWFVYHMMRQASLNNGNMANVLRDFERKLELLAQETENDCPVCLEPFEVDGARIAETLGCCHKVCKQCWAHWTRVMHGNPFCPLCKHDEFVNVVAQHGHR